MSVTIFDPSKPFNQLLSLNSTWSQKINSSIPKLFPQTAGGQVPKILWLGCADSRVPETTLLGLNPGEVFVHRNIANLVHPSDVSFPAVLEYAIEHVNITDIILCGHTTCGGVAAALDPAPITDLPIANWLLPLKALSARHSKMIAQAADKSKTLVRLSVQHGMKQLRANTTVGDKKVVVHGAIYDVSTGLLSFLEGADEVEPPVDALANPTNIIRVGNFDTREVRTAPQTKTSKAVTFTTPYSKPPRIVLGLTSFDLTIYNDNPRLLLSSSQISAKGFQLNVDTWGSSIINNATCTWLEIPDDDDYADVQTGAFATYDDHPWNVWQALTTRKVTFAKPYATPPTVMVWLSGLDCGQNPKMSCSVYATEITTTGFVINLDEIANASSYGQWSQWVAYSSNSGLGLSSGTFGPNHAVSQSTSGTVALNNLNLSTAAAPAVARAINAVYISQAGTNYVASLTTQNVKGSSVDWTASTSGNSTMPTCQGSYLVIPNM